MQKVWLPYFRIRNLIAFIAFFLAALGLWSGSIKNV